MNKDSHLSSRSSVSSSREVVLCCSAALFTNISIRPNFSTTCSTTCLQFWTFWSYPRSAPTAIGFLASLVLFSSNKCKVSSASLSSWPLTKVNATVAPFFHKVVAWYSPSYTWISSCNQRHLPLHPSPHHIYYLFIFFNFIEIYRKLILTSSLNFLKKVRKCSKFKFVVGINILRKRKVW